MTFRSRVIDLNLAFAGIQFISRTVDATAMTHFRMNIWTPDPTSLPAVFKIKIVDFGANGAFGGGDDVEHELTLNANSTPPLVTGNWVAYFIIQFRRRNNQKRI